MADANDYTEQLKKLSPPGQAWPTEDDSLWVKLLSAIAQELARVDARATQLVDEALPDTTYDMLTDWERVAGLPDPCSGLGASIAIRRKDLLAQITARGGQSPQYFIDVAAELGYTISVTEFNQFRVGRNAVGDALRGEDWEYTWQVNSALDTVTYFFAGQNGAGDALAEWGNERLECVITARKPAHTIVLFSYS